MSAPEPKPLCIDLFCGLGGWAEGGLAEGFSVVGFDNVRHIYGDHRYPAQLVLQDALTIHGSQFRNAALIVASPPCTEYSYMAMPWSRGKQIASALRGQGEFPEGYKGSRTITELNALFDACFRIRREASEAAGHRIPMVVENVKGAQPWVGPAKANFGSFYLWGDVESVGGKITGCVPKFGEVLRAARRGVKSGRPSGNGVKDWTTGALRGYYESSIKPDGQKTPEGNCGEPMWKDREISRYAHPTAEEYEKHGFDDGRKVPMNFHEHEKTGKPGRSFQSVAVLDSGTKSAQDGLGNSRSDSRKAASAQIAKIPFPLASHIAKVFKPTGGI